MKIVHVASAFTPENRFGGPTRLALELGRELRDRGHHVVVLGAAIGWERVPEEIDGVPVRLARGRLPPGPLGWAALVAPGLRSLVREEARDADLVHIHLARDVVTLGAGLAARPLGVPIVLQTHGMIDRPRGPLAAVVDRFATTRVVSAARTVLTLTVDEQQEVARLSRGLVPAPLFRNGVRVDETARPAEAGPEIVFAARLHPRKGGVAFARAATEVSSIRPAARFALIGPDEGDLDAISRIVDEHPAASIELVGGLPPDGVRRRLAAARAYVLPAEREPFGVTLLEAMSAGRPVVLHATATLAPTIVEAGAGWTFGEGGDFRRLEDALEFVVDDDRAVEEAGVRALSLVRSDYSIQSVVDDLLARYREATSGA